MADPTNPAAPQLDQNTLAMIVGNQQPTDTMGKITNFIGNPLVSGALGAYLGTIGSPRSEGFGHAIATGGLEGLGAFNQARQYQANLPLIRAKTLEGIAGIGQKQASAQNLQSEARLHGAQASMLGPQPDLAQKYETMATQPGLPPEQVQNLHLIAAGLKSGGKFTPADALKYAQQGNLDATKIALQKAQTTEAQAKTTQVQQETPANVAEKQASAAHLGAETQLAGQQSNLLRQIAPAALSSVGLGGGMSATPAPAPAPAAPSAAPPPTGGGDAIPPDLGFKPSHHVPMADGSTAYYNEADKHWHVKGPSGWTAIP